MFFAVEFKCRVAPLPLPTLFITAISRSNVAERQNCINNIFTILIPLLEKAQYEYNAVFVPNEPTNVTHDLSRANSKENVIICSSLYFRQLEDVKKFIENLSTGYRQ